MLREIFIIDPVLKTNPWTYTIKDLKGEKITGSFGVTDIDTSGLATKKDFITLKAEGDKLDINKSINQLIPTSLNILKTKVDDLDAGKLKTVPVDLKQLSGVIDNKVIQNTKLSTLETKVNNLKRKISDRIILIDINQYSADQQNCRCW